MPRWRRSTGFTRQMAGDYRILADGQGWHLHLNKAAEGWPPRGTVRKIPNPPTAYNLAPISIFKGTRLLREPTEC